MSFFASDLASGAVMAGIIVLLVGLLAVCVWLFLRPPAESFELAPGFEVNSLLRGEGESVNWDDRMWRTKWTTPTDDRIHPGMGDGPAKNLPSFADPESCTAACQNLAVEMTAAGDRDPGYVANAYEACAQTCRMNFLWRLKG